MAITYVSEFFAKLAKFAKFAKFDVA